MSGGLTGFPSRQTGAGVAEGLQDSWAPHPSPRQCFLPLHAVTSSKPPRVRARVCVCVCVFGSCEGFLQLRQAGATLHHGARAFHYRGPSCSGAQAPDAQAQ